jgi:hypothetical protein
VTRDPQFKLIELSVKRTNGFGVPLSELLDPCDEIECERVDLGSDPTLYHNEIRAQVVKYMETLLTQARSLVRKAQ